MSEESTLNLGTDLVGSKQVPKLNPGWATRLTTVAAQCVAACTETDGPSPLREAVAFSIGAHSRQNGDGKVVVVTIGATTCTGHNVAVSAEWYLVDLMETRDHWGTIRTDIEQEINNLESMVLLS